jgi:hypothetical protein
MVGMRHVHVFVRVGQAEVFFGVKQVQLLVGVKHVQVLVGVKLVKSRILVGLKQVRWLEISMSKYWFGKADARVIHAQAPTLVGPPARCSAVKSGCSRSW